MVNGKEFIKGQLDYNYGFFDNEIKSRIYISDKTIDEAVSTIKWELNDFEKEYLRYLKIFEGYHRQYCKGEIEKDLYDRLVDETYNNYEIQTGYDFGQNVDELTNVLINYFSDKK